ncbi:cyclic lactone autoinducer peptide [Clostridium cellulovorans]|uniref:Putative lipoprotein n=1 Tax=Clostridium cellulovorans (strain ATCC 35296 / DSM 3052 / OCM 3 / 743B) TaxID=573061 RepID=D9SVE8_CLOC7|nr:cyclic lactone autoinducer peptide [Clostridium cellulovorans]ADL51072.1 putative lipoprotein [Clostridium cellulovorans 743B]
MRKTKSKVLSLFAVLTTVIASMVASSACFWYYYQPEEPEILRDK